MKFMSLILVGLILALFAGCDASEDALEPNTETICGKSVDCINEMTWNILLSKSRYSDYIEVWINNEKIYNECFPDPQYAITRGGSVVELTLWNFRPLARDGSSKFNLMIKNLGNCNVEPTIYYQMPAQSYKSEIIDNSRRIIVNLTN